MVDLLLATVVLAVIVALVCVAGLALTALPFVVATDMAEQRQLSTTRAGAAALVSIALGLGLAYLARHAGAPKPLLVLPLALTWAAPAALWLMEAGQNRLGGRVPAHD